MKSALFIFLLFINAPVLFAAGVPATCSEIMEELQAEQRSRLSRLEENFMKAVWDYRKYQETVYTPLWEAARQKNDRFSPENRMKGAVAFERYRHLADTDQENARAAVKRVQEVLDYLESGFIQNNACNVQGELPQRISDFRNCMEVYAAETTDRIAALRRLISDFYEEQERFSEMVERHITDNPSDHDTFEDRFRDYLFADNVQAVSEFLRLVRELQDRFEQKWPGKKCCQACEADQTIGQDPVLSQIRLDAQGEKGVAGQMVNNARILDAFNKMDEAREDSEDQTRS
jgi:hypothetical protein